MKREESKIAAFFDFDGIWFPPHSNWQIKDIHIGQVGSLIQWEDACRTMDAMRKKKRHGKLQDYYAIPSFKWAKVSRENSRNITPPHYLIEIANYHKLRNHDLYLLSQANCRDLIELIDMSQQERRSTAKWKDPFQDITFFSCDLEDKIPKERRQSHCIGKKTKYLLSFLAPSLKSQTSPVPWQNQEKMYNKIFLYYTQIEYEFILKMILDKYHNIFKTRRMAIIPSYIAKVS